METKNVIKNYSEYRNSYNCVIRYIYETAHEAKPKLGDMPAKDDKTPEAKLIRQTIKRQLTRISIIETCQQICDMYDINASATRGAGLKDLRARILADVPQVDVNDNAVTFGKLPSYLKSVISNYNNIYIVRPASWIETILICANNHDNGNPARVYQITTAPRIDTDGNVYGAGGELTNSDGTVIDNARDIFDTWDREFALRNIANSAGRAARDSKLAELKRQ